MLHGQGILPQGLQACCLNSISAAHAALLECLWLQCVQAEPALTGWGRACQQAGQGTQAMILRGVCVGWALPLSLLLWLSSLLHASSDQQLSMGTAPCRLNVSSWLCVAHPQYF